MADMEFNPDATHVNGHGYDYDSTGRTWAATIAAPGDAFFYEAANQNLSYIKANDGTNQWELCGRAIFLFDISALPVGVTITGVTMSLYGFDKDDAIDVTPGLNVYESAPANDNALVAGDYDSLSAVAFCDTPISYADWKVASPWWNNFVFNAAGLAFVEAAVAGDGVVRLGTREPTYDVGGTPPTWKSAGDDRARLYCYGYLQGVGYKPKLVITYGWAGIINGITNPAKINGIGVGSIAKVNGI